MTGFGQADGTVASLAVQVDVRTVNHRFFTPSIKLPGPFARWEPEIRELMRRQVARGHVTLTVRTERTSGSVLGIDLARFGAAVEQLRALQQRFALEGPLDLATVLRMPTVVGGVSDDDTPPDDPLPLLALVERALEALGRARSEEGARLAVVLSERLEVMAQGMARIAIRAPERLVAHRERLRTSVAELAGGIPLDEARLAQEIALLADRLDVAEEIDRFGSHVEAFRTTLADRSGEPVGKRLGFLLQEMLREVNTTGSKAADATILHEVVTLKEELERIREQVENLE